MGEYLYQVVTINGRTIAFEADEVEVDSERYVFSEDGEVIGEFERKNVSGYFKDNIEDIEDEYEW